jgi:hypothetical protein
LKATGEDKKFTFVGFVGKLATYSGILVVMITAPPNALVPYIAALLPFRTVTLDT